jgi:uncharacterized coiled-coil protein SlyX
MNDEFNQRQSDTKLADIEKMIVMENDQDKRNILQILQFQTNQSSGIIKGISHLETTIKNTLAEQTKQVEALSDRVEDHEKKLEEHHDLVTSSKGSWKTFTWAVGVISLVGMTVAATGYNVIDNLRLTVVEMKTASQLQTSIIPELSKRLDMARDTEKAIQALRETVTDLRTFQDEQASTIEEIRVDLGMVKSLKVIKASKRSRP